LRQTETGSEEILQRSLEFRNRAIYTVGVAPCVTSAVDRASITPRASA
jgi:hypothetical protein